MMNGISLMMLGSILGAAALPLIIDTLIDLELDEKFGEDTRLTPSLEVPAVVLTVLSMSLFVIGFIFK